MCVFFLKNLVLLLFLQNLSPGMSVHEFACIKKLAPNCTIPTSLGIDFNDTLQNAGFEIVSSLGENTLFYLLESLY